MTHKQAKPNSASDGSPSKAWSNKMFKVSNEVPKLKIDGFSQEIERIERRLDRLEGRLDREGAEHSSRRDGVVSDPDHPG